MSRDIFTSEIKKRLRALMGRGKLKYEEVQVKKIDFCSICFENFTPQDDDIIRLDCNEGHIFHLRCIQIWAENSNACPLCRQAIF